MEITTMDSKQISHITYIEETRQLIIHYHAGWTNEVSPFDPNEYLEFKCAANKYDYFVKKISDRSPIHGTM